MLQWIEDNMIEIIGALFALIYLFLEIRERSFMWVVGIFSSAFYILIFYRSKVYAQMGLNVYFLCMSLYGLYCWYFKPRIENESLKISRINLKTILYTGSIAAILFVFIANILIRTTDSPVPYSDALLAALSVVATWMVARKILEHWVIWIFVNFFSVGLYFYLKLYPTAFLYLVYAVMSVGGLFKWYRSMLKQTEI